MRHRFEARTESSLPWVPLLVGTVVLVAVVLVGYALFAGRDKPDKEPGAFGKIGEAFGD